MTGNSSESCKGLKRNPIAKDLATAKYRARIKQSRKRYTRKGRVAQPDRASDF